jgi:class 3 adenylate cyclase
VDKIGAHNVVNYTVIGVAANKGHTLQEMAKAKSIRISQRTYDPVKSAVRVKTLPEVLMKEQTTPERVYELLDFLGSALSSSPPRCSCGQK